MFRGRERRQSKNKSKAPQVLGYLTMGVTGTACQASESWDFWNPAFPGLVWWSGTLGNQPPQPGGPRREVCKLTEQVAVPKGGDFFVPICAHHQPLPSAWDTAASLGVSEALDSSLYPNATITLRFLPAPSFSAVGTHCCSEDFVLFLQMTDLHFNGRLCKQCL